MQTDDVEAHLGGALLSSGRHGGAFLFSTSVALASDAAAAATDTAAWCSWKTWATGAFHVSSFPAEDCSARRLRAADLTPLA